MARRSSAATKLKACNTQAVTPGPGTTHATLPAPAGRSVSPAAGYTFNSASSNKQTLYSGCYTTRAPPSIKPSLSLHDARIPCHGPHCPGHHARPDTCHGTHKASQIRPATGGVMAPKASQVGPAELQAVRCAKETARASQGTGQQPSSLQALKHTQAAGLHCTQGPSAMEGCLHRPAHPVPLQANPCSLSPSCLQS